MKEAIEKIREQICNEKGLQRYCRDSCMHGTEYCAYSKAIEALEKQIPMKPFVNNGRLQCVNGHNLPIQHYKYCPFCGQKINWK